MTGSVWPSRCTRPMHCSCTPGDQSSSPNTAVLHTCCNPSMPAPERRLISITWLSPAMNASFAACFWFGDSLPVYMTGL